MEFPAFPQPPSIDFDFHFPTLEDVFGSFEGPTCDLSDDDFLSHHEYARLQIQGMAKSFYKGWYHSKAEIVSDDCFGEWLYDYHKEFKAGWKKFKADPFSITKEDALAHSEKVVDIHFRLKDSCKVQRFYDDVNYWCQDHMDVCAGNDFDWINNIMSAGVPIAGEAFQLFKTAFYEDDWCYTDLESIAEVNKVTEEVASILSYIFGFDLKWNTKRQDGHYTLDEVSDQYDAYWGNMEDMDGEDEAYDMGDLFNLL